MVGSPLLVRLQLSSVRLQFPSVTKLATVVPGGYRVPLFTQHKSLEKLKNYYFKNVVNNLLCRGFVPCVNVTIFDTLKTVAPIGVDVSF